MRQANRYPFLNLTKNLKFTVCVLSILILTGCNSSKVTMNNKDISNSKSSQTTQNLKIDEVQIMNTIKDLSKDYRVFGTESEKNASDYLKSKLNNYGYNIEIQEFKVHEQKRNLLFNDSLDDFFNLNPINSDLKGVGRNIIAKPNNYSKNKKDIYIMAHYDTTKNTVGVYDNATGVSSVIEIARVLNDFNSDNFNVCFLLFSAEEYFSSGSRYFVSQLSENEKKNILGAINIDMVGCNGFKIKDLPQIGNPTIRLCPWIKKDPLENIFNSYFDNKYKVDDMGGVSDDIAFARIGIPTIYFADENCLSGAEIEEQSRQVQLDSVNTTIIADLSHDIVEFLKDFDIDKFNELNAMPDIQKGTFETQENF